MDTKSMPHTDEAMVFVVLCCCLMLVLILRLISQDLFNWQRASGDHLINGTRVTWATPSRISMRRVTSPFCVTQIKSQQMSTSCSVSASLMLCDNQQPANIRTLMFRSYWGVSVAAFHHILAAPWVWFHEAFTDGNLFGQVSCVEMGPLKTIDVTTTQVELHDKKPGDAELHLGPAPRHTYPLVLCIMPDDHFLNQLQESGCPTQGGFRGFGALLCVIHVEDEVCRIATHVLANYLKHFSPTPGSDTTNPEVMSPRATHLVSLFTPEDEVCAVCQDARISVVILPCRHACTCAGCFQRLSHRCPMCRSFIQSYFMLNNSGSQPGAEPTAEASTSSGGSEEATSWRHRLHQLNHRYSQAMGLQEH